MDINHNKLSAKIMGWELKNIPYAYFANNTPIYMDCWVDKDGEFKYLVEEWRPKENANQLMMIIEKMIEDGKYWLSACIEKDGYSVEVFDENSWQDNTPENLGESKFSRTYNIAVIEACLQAKGVE